MPPSTQKRVRKQDVSAPEQPVGTVEAPHRPRKRRDQEVIDAAAKVFYERGFADASVQDVADELGILKGSLYDYIETKEDQLFRPLEEPHDEVQAILEEVAAVEGLKPLSASSCTSASRRCSTSRICRASPSTTTTTSG